MTRPRIPSLNRGSLCLTLWTSLLRSILGVLVAIALSGISPAGAAGEDAGGGPTPPRLSLLEGEVLFWRQGQEDWEPAHINIPVAPGDFLQTGPGSRLEVQIGGRAFLRADANTQVTLVSREPDYIQLDVTAGRASLDLREMKRGHAIQIGTPRAAFTIDRPGYYRVDVDEDSSTFVARRGGRAVARPSDGPVTDVGSAEEVVIEGKDHPRLVRRSAPDLDGWDHWNYDATDRVLDAASERYAPADMYGIHELSRYGSWRIEPPYGPIWVPAAVPSGWVPYSTGRWIWDPYYEWTWVDEAPWGWAPYHYGRWVRIGSFWGWAPGPIRVATVPVYSPALVAFFAPPVVHVGPLIGWVALGWGEPLIPWWGPVGFVGRPWWGGWHGPCVINNVVVHRTKIVNVTDIKDYKNRRHHGAIVAARPDDFDQGGRKLRRLGREDARGLQPVRGTLPVKPEMRNRRLPGNRELRQAEGLRPAARVAGRLRENRQSRLGVAKMERARDRKPPIAPPSDTPRRSLAYPKKPERSPWTRGAVVPPRLAGNRLTLARRSVQEQPLDRRVQPELLPERRAPAAPRHREENRPALSRPSAQERHSPFAARSRNRSLGEGARPAPPSIGGKRLPLSRRGATLRMSARPQQREQADASARGVRHENTHVTENRQNSAKAGNWLAPPRRRGAALLSTSALGREGQLNSAPARARSQGGEAPSSRAPQKEAMQR